MAQNAKKAFCGAVRASSMDWGGGSPSASGVKSSRRSRAALSPVKSQSWLPGISAVSSRKPGRRSSKASRRLDNSTLADSYSGAAPENARSPEKTSRQAVMSGSAQTASRILPICPLGNESVVFRCTSLRWSIATRTIPSSTNRVLAGESIVLGLRTRVVHLTGSAGRFGLTGGFFCSPSIAIAIAFSSCGSWPAMTSAGVCSTSTSGGTPTFSTP